MELWTISRYLFFRSRPSAISTKNSVRRREAKDSKRVEEGELGPLTIFKRVYRGFSKTLRMMKCKGIFSTCPCKILEANRSQQHNSDGRKRLEWTYWLTRENSTHIIITRIDPSFKFNQRCQNTWLILPQPVDRRRSPGQADPGPLSGLGARAITVSAAAPTATAEVSLGPLCPRQLVCRVHRACCTSQSLLQTFAHCCI